MPAPIQTIPQGLLGLLQLKQTGANPAELLNTVQPSVEMFSYWANRQVVDIGLAFGIGSVSSITVATAQGGNVFNLLVQVPQTETWWVEAFTVACTMLPAEYMRFAPGFFVPAGGGPHLLAADEADLITGRNRGLWVTARNFWLGPGYRPLVMIFDNLTAGNITVTGSMRAVRVPI